MRATISAPWLIIPPKRLIISGLNGKILIFLTQKSHSILPMYREMATIVATRMSHGAPEINLQLITLWSNHNFRSDYLLTPSWCLTLPSIRPLILQIFQFYFTKTYHPSPYWTHSVLPHQANGAPRSTPQAGYFNPMKRTLYNTKPIEGNIL